MSSTNTLFYSVEIEGVSPLLMRAYRMQEGKEGGKVRPGDKTKAWHEKQRKEDWYKSAYHDGVGFYIPPEVVEAALFEAAKKIRKGQDFKRDISVIDSRIPLLVPNGNGWKELNASLDETYVPEHIDIRGVRLGKVRVDRCRPVFRKWRLKFTLRFEDSIEPKDVETTIANIGIGDFRPRFGQVRKVLFEQVGAATLTAA